MQSYQNLRQDHFEPLLRHRPDIVDKPLYVVCPIFNPIRYSSRWKLYKDFERQFLSFGECVLVTIECAFGEREFVLDKQDNDKHILIQVRTKHEAWIKENLINIAVSRLPLDWSYLAWIDPDTQFVRPDIVGETIQQLQHYAFVQMFRHANDLGPNYEIIQRYTGFGWCYQNMDQCPPINGKAYYTIGKKGVGYLHPGYAWACTREAFDHVGGLIDWGILGGGDTFMAYCLAGWLNKRTMPNSLGPAGVRWLGEWQKRCDQYILRNIGYVEGTINHYFHGIKAERGYWDRGTILTRAKFNPEKDIKRDWQGVWQLNTNNIELRDGIRRYFRMRNEDRNVL